MQEFLSYLIPGIMRGMIYALIALGFVIVYKCSGVLNFAQPWLVVLGAYVFFAISAQLGLPIWVSVLLTILLAVALGFGVQNVVLRPLIGQPILPNIMATLTIGLLLSGLMVLIWGVDTIMLPSIFPKGGVEIASVSVSYESISFLIISLILFGLLTLFFRRTRMGLGMMAAAEDQQAAQSMGVRANVVMGFAWAIACLVAIIGGILLGTITGVHYTNIAIGLRCVAVLILGGLESFGGVMLAGPIIGAIEGLSCGYFDPLLVGGGTEDFVPFVVLIIILMFRPYGLFGWKRIERI